MTWTALLPIKPRGARKRRLSGCLSSQARDAMTDRLLDRTLAVLAAEPRIGRTAILSPQRQHKADWIADAAPTLNGALAAAAARVARPLLVLFPDLPAMTAADVAALLDAAGDAGVAVAADLRGTGTNALALADDRPAAFLFGADSRARFGAAFPDAAVVTRHGLAFDCDLPEDLERLTEGL